MANELELISDGEGLAIIGSPADVDLFLGSMGLVSEGHEASPLVSAGHGGAALLELGAQLSENSGRWVKLTKESAESVKKLGLMPTKIDGVSHAMIGKPGEISQWIQIVTKPGAMLTNPAILSGLGGLMAQRAMQQQMEEITEYLVTIDEKLDELLRMQKNQVLARMDGVALAIREAMLLRETVGTVSDVTWSKVQSTSVTVLETQAFALRQLADLTEKIERQRKLDDIAEVSEEAVAEAKKLVMVLARCFQLHDAIAVLELDRVLDASPEEIDKHRLGLQAARRDRLEIISSHTNRLLERVADAAGKANSKVLLHPTVSPAIVASSNEVAHDVHEFHEVIGVDSEHQSSEARRWSEAAGEVRDKAIRTGAEGIDAAKVAGTQVVDQAKTVKSKLTERLAAARLRREEVSGDADD